MYIPSATREENVTEDSVQFTKCNCKNITSELLQSAHIREHIDNLLMAYSDGAHQQGELDNLYDNFTTVVKLKMEDDGISR